ncbi:MAG TPA: hypothetical protein PKI11_03155 [Candidatus Hydrogenedentes bacterium]|nr:hypothetical protein [Candidatus Hydrogenedentota bacterium]HNT86479.1 hypothetical protein [Candidatus Hydrogenedentota bacterium]
MNAWTRWIAFWNRQVRKFTIYDVKLAQTGAMAFALIIAKIFPCILAISIWWFVAALILCMIRPCYVILFKNDATEPGGDA